MTVTYLSSLSSSCTSIYGPSLFHRFLKPHIISVSRARARDSDSVSICWMDDVCGVDAVVWEPSVIVVETLDYLVYWIQRECESSEDFGR